MSDPLPAAAPTVVDLFCGCGGIAWGFARAGFHVLAGVDADETALQTFAANFADARALRRDLAGDGVDALVAELGLAAGELDVLVGGPPCQGFSKNVTRSGRFLQDPKNLLVRSFVRAVELLRPKLVLMENVAEMANAFGGAFRDELRENFGKFGYAVHFDVHNAAEHGVPQRRRRVVFVASRTAVAPQMPAAVAQVGRSQGTHAGGAAPKGAISVWQAIGDLAPLLGPQAEPNRYHGAPFSSYQRAMRRGTDGSLTDHQERKLRPQQQARYHALQPGQGLPDLPAHLRPKTGYSGAYGRLTQDMIAPTITRWCFHPGSGRFGHPAEPRILSIRELARLQGFSDDFVFRGSNQAKSWQIGNAVPPVLAEAFAAQMRAVLP